MSWQFDPLPMFGFDIVVADPPWWIELYSDAGIHKSAQAHYELMSLDEIRALRVGDLVGSHSLLLLWGCGWMRPSDRESVIEAWGFQYKSELAWVKTTRSGKRRMGTGYRTRSMHESIYLATNGNPYHRAFPSVFDGIAREHSRKPDEFYAMVDRHVPPNRRKLDLFSRQSRPGWTSWGREASKFDEAAA